MMSERDFLLMEIVQKKILCTIDKKTEVITITVTDQDPMIAATMKNRDVVVVGITNGLAGYAVGNYLGYLIYQLLSAL